MKVRISSRCQPSSSVPIASTSSGADSTELAQKRRLMLASSGFGPSSSVGSIGSSAIPQIGQLPGPGRRICGCIGQVHTAPPTGSGKAPKSTAHALLHSVAPGLEQATVRGAGHAGSSRAPAPRLGARAMAYVPEALRAAALVSKAWPYEEARKLLKRYPEGPPAG